MITCPGSIIVASIKVNQSFLPLNFILEKEYATKEDEITVPKVAIVVTKSEFLKNVANVVPPKPFQPV
jgi:hypothetical protein